MGKRSKVCISCKVFLPYGATIALLETAMKQQPRQILGKNLRCANCAQRTDDWYMLRDDIWQSIAQPGERYLCLACVSKRLGRELIRSDYADLPINSTE